MEENKVVAITEDKKKKKKGKLSVILLIAGLLLCWVPYLSLVLCAAALVSTIIANKKGFIKKKAVYIIRIVLCVVGALFALLVIIGTIVPNTYGAKEFAKTELSKSARMQVYEDLRLKSDSLGDDDYHVTGELLLSRRDLSENKQYIYKMDVDCKVYCPEDTDAKSKMLENNSVLQKDPVEVMDLPEPITLIDKEKAIKDAERVFHTNVKLKNEGSYVRNKATVQAYYDDDGDLKIEVLLDYSAQNGFGGMTRSNYLVVFEVMANGSYFAEQWGEVED